MLSFQGGIRVPSYTASKSGVAGLTKALANEWAAQGHQRQRDRARLYRHQQHRRAAGRRDPQPPDPRAHPGRPLGRAGRPRRRGGVPRLVRVRLCQRPHPRRRRRLAGALMRHGRLLRRAAAPPDRAGARAAAAERPARRPCRRRRGQCRGRPRPARPRRRRWSAACPTMRSARPRPAICGATASTPPASPTGPGRMGLYFLSPGRRAARRPTSSTTARAAPSRWPGRTISTGTRCSTAPTCSICPASRRRSGRARPTPRSPPPRRRAAQGVAGLVRRQLPRAALGSAGTAIRARSSTELVAEGRHLVRQPSRHLAAARPRISAATARTRRREAAEAAFDAFPEPAADRLDRAPRRRRRHATASPRGSTRRDGAAQTEEVVVAGIVDRIGAGDAFAAGVLHGLRRGPRSRRDRPLRPRADLPQAQPAGRREPVRPARHRRLPGRRARRPALTC